MLIFGKETVTIHVDLYLCDNKKVAGIFNEVLLAPHFSNKLMLQFKLKQDVFSIVSNNSQHRILKDLKEFIIVQINSSNQFVELKCNNKISFVS